jgi:hypothetical protein
LLLHSKSSRAKVAPEHEELTLKPHSWSGVVSQDFSEAPDLQKPSVFRVKDSALHPYLQGAINLTSRRSRLASPLELTSGA